MSKKIKLPFLICLLFCISYIILAIIRHNHYGSFGFDLGLRDQVVWLFSQFKQPITTIHFYPFTSIFTDHMELIYIPLSAFYRLWSSPIMLLILEPAFVCFSGLAVYMLTIHLKLNKYVSYVLLISYLMFYGVQHAMWFDVHSASFGASFLIWMIYFMEIKNMRMALIGFFLTIICKENMAMLTLFVASVFIIKDKSKIAVYIILLSLFYLFLLFGIYYPYITSGYRYENSSGLLSNSTNFSSFYDSTDKKQVIFYSLFWFGFIPLLAPLFLLPAFVDLYNYFVIASNLTASHGLFMHYRITLAPLMVWATIMTIYKFKKLNNKYTAFYLLICVLFLQYHLHLPLSYLVKNWFWTEPSGVKNINELISFLPKNASVVSQNNITPHISQRERIFTLWPEKKEFKTNSPCMENICNWFRWEDEPEYLIVDTSTDWDTRHLLTDRDNYIRGLNNLESYGVIRKHKQIGNAVLYRVLKQR